MSGIFLPLAAESDRVRKVVYVAGMTPRPGISPMQVVRSDDSVFNPAWIGKDPIRDANVARESLFHDCSPEISKWAISTMRLMVPMRVLNEPLPIEIFPANEYSRERQG